MRDEDTNWIWPASWGRSDDEDAGVVYFRKRVTYRKSMGRMTCRISADSRYKLYVNGEFVQEGPAKGDLETWYADTADVTPYLAEGENAVCAEVLRYPEDRNLRNHSLYRTDTPCLYIEDTSENHKKILDGRTGWRARKAGHIHFLGETTVPAPLHILEDACGDGDAAGWMMPTYHDDLWEEARPYRRSEIRLADAPFHLADRPVPMLEHEEKEFVPEAVIRDAGGMDRGALQAALERMLGKSEADHQWELWRQMVRNHLTTCVENDTDERSDCHAWASVLLYELPAVYLGVQPAEPGYRSVRIAPVPGHLTWAKGTAATPRGDIQVSWTRTREGLQCETVLPEGMRREEHADNPWITA